MLKSLGASKSKGPKQYSQNRLRYPVPQGD